MSEAKVRVSIVSGVRTGLTKIKAQFTEFRRELNSEFANFFAFGSLLAGFDAMIKKASDIKNIADRYGAPARELQRVTNAGKAHGVVMEDVGKAWNKLALNQQHAIDGSDEARKHFEDLGISMHDVATMSIDQLFYRIADSASTAGDRGKAYAAVVALMGRFSGALFTTLEQGQASIKSTGDAFGTMSDEAVEHLHQVEVQIEKMKNTLFIFGGDVLIFFKKIIESVADLITVSAIHMYRAVGNLFDAMGEAMKGHFAKAGQQLKEFGTNLLQGDPIGAAWAPESGLKEIWHPEPEAKKAPKKRLDDEVEPSKKEAASLEKLQSLRERLAEIQRRAMNEELEGQGKINALIAQRAAVLSQMANETDNEKKLELEIKAAEIEENIGQAKRQLAKDLEQQADAVARAQEHFQDAQQEREFNSLKTTQQKKAFLQKQADELAKKASGEANEEQRLELLTKREGILGKMQGLDKDKTEAPKIAADSLARIGGGGNVAVTGVDKNFREMQTHTNLLRTIARNTQPKETEGELLMEH